MGFFLVQGGASLYKVDPTSGAATALTLPTGVTLSTTRKPRFAILNQWIVMVNSPTRNLAIDPEGTVRVLVPRPPASAPVLAAGSSTGVTGAVKARMSFIVLGSSGELLMESPLSPPSLSVTLSNNDIAVTRAAISQDSISARRLYRTAGGGTEYFQWFDIDGNTQFTGLSNLADAGLALLPAQSESLIAPPGTLQSSRMKIICTWKNRLWGVSVDPDDIDTAVFTENGVVYQWPNSLTAYPKGQDAEGIVAFAPRENELGLLKRNGLWQITGDSTDNFEIVQIAGGQDATGKCGCHAPDSVCVINDRVYWLGKDGVYEWGAEGVRNITDETVKPWFTSDTYFNRSRFGSAFAKYNEITDHYELHLAAAGSSTEDRWVGFNLRNRKWYGPHRTALFTPSHAGLVVDANGLPIVLVGGTNGIVYSANSSNYRDGSATAIDYDVFPRWHHGDDPDVQHHWGEPSIFSKIEGAGTLDVIPYVGGLNASAGTTKSHNLTLGRQRLSRIGQGRLARLRFRNNEVNQGCALMGYEFPYHEIGRR